MVSQSNSDLLSKTNKLPALLEPVGLSTDSDSDNIRSQFDHRTAWNHYQSHDTGDGANGTHVSATPVNTELRDSTRGNSVIMTKSDVNAVNGGISAKNVSDLRTQKLVVPSNNTNYFENVWKSLTEQGKIFSSVYNVTDRSEVKERALLHSAANFDDSSSTLVQKRDKRATEVKHVASATTTTEEENSFSQHVGNPVAPTPDTNDDSREYEQCLNAEYVVYTWVLCLVALATALKLYYLVKTTLATVMVSVFTTLILVAYKEVFEE
jgi:hypothetical protein